MNYYIHLLYQLQNLLGIDAFFLCLFPQCSEDKTQTVGASPEKPPLKELASMFIWHHIPLNRLAICD